MASLYKRGDIFWIKYYKNGVEVRRSLKCKDKKVAQVKQKQIELDLEQGSAGMQSSVRLAPYLKEYLEYSQKKKSTTTYQEDVRQLTKFVSSIKSTELNNISSLEVSEYMKQYFPPNYKPKTYNNYLKILKAFFNYAIKHELIKKNPAEKVSELTNPVKHPRFLEDDEIDRLIKVAKIEYRKKTSKQSHLYPIIVTALLTGMRIGELLNLNWNDIDFKKDIIIVRGETAKSRRFRAIPMHSKVKALLNRKKAKKGAVFTYRGHKITTNSYGGLNTLVCKAQIKQCTYHTFRHTYASKLVMQGVPLYTVAELLGHSSQEVTKRYAHLAPDYKKDQVEKININI